MNKKERLDLANWAIQYAQKNGADQVAVSISNSREIEIGFREKKLEELKEATSNTLNINVYTGQRYSGHSTNDLRKDSLKDFIKEAVASTAYLTSDPYRLLPDPRFYPKESKGEFAIYDQSYPDIEPESRVKLAAEIEQIALQQSDKIISVSSSYSDSFSETVRVHSNGFSGENEGTMFSAGTSVTVKDKDGGRPADWNWATTRFKKDLPSAQFLAKGAVDRALAKVGQKKIQSGKYTMLVENRAASRILAMLQRPMSARALQQKSSYLDGKIGQRIASEKFTLIDDPTIPKGLGSRHYDGEGLNAIRRVKIDKGVLKEYYIDNYYGRKLEMDPNSGSTSNLVFEYGSRSLQEMQKDIQNGILVNGFIGGNSNPTTGDFSFGIVGLLIENGQVITPVNEMNISGNAADFWTKLSEMGNDAYQYSSWRRPSMLFEDIHFSGL